GVVSEPIETLVVTFFEHPCLTARLSDGTIVVSIRDLCDAVGLNLSSQLRRLRADEDFWPLCTGCVFRPEAVYKSRIFYTRRKCRSG
ncbi:MAG: hypothetical protein WBZ57_20580, partial [Pseudomonas graminis]